MATQRYVSTSFWDDPWICDLSPEEKFLYLYLMTNTLTNVAGVYKITVRRMNFDTGLQPAVIEKILRKFKKDGKVLFVGEYIILPNFPKHQQWENRNKIRLGIEIVIKSLPKNILCELLNFGYKFPIHEIPSLNINELQISSDNIREDGNYSDSDLDSDSDSDLDSDSYRVVIASQDEAIEERMSNQQIVDLFHSTCRSLPKVTLISEKRQKALTAIRKVFTDEKIKDAFVKAEASDFLCGRDSRAWVGCSFDWLTVKGNMLKVLEGNYSKSGRKARYSTEPGTASVDDYNHN